MEATKKSSQFVTNAFLFTEPLAACGIKTEWTPLIQKDFGKCGKTSGEHVALLKRQLTEESCVLRFPGFSSEEVLTRYLSTEGWTLVHDAACSIFPVTCLNNKILVSRKAWKESKNRNPYPKGQQRICQCDKLLFF